MFKRICSLFIKYLIGIVGCIVINCSFNNDITEPDPYGGHKISKLNGKWNLRNPLPDMLYAYYIFTDSLVFVRGAWFQDSEIFVTTIKGDWYISERKEIEGDLILSGTHYDSTFYLNKDSTVGELKKELSGSVVSQSTYPELSGYQVFLRDLTFSGRGSYYDHDASFDLYSTLSVEDQINRTPVFLNTKKKFSTDTGKTVSIPLKVTDPDWNPVTLSLVDGPQKSLLNQSDKSFTWQPELSDTGLNTIIISASDGRAAVFDTFTINVHVNRNSPVLIVPNKNYSTFAGDSLTIAFKVQDPDSDSVSVKIEKGPKNACLKTNSSSDTLSFFWLPAKKDTGSNVIILSASDGKHIVLDTVIIDVQRRNQAPFFYNNKKQFTVMQGTAALLQLYVTDPDTDQISLSLVEGPEKGLLDQNEKLFTWYPQNFDSGLNTIIISASDGKISVFDTFTINVTPDPNQSPPVISLTPNYSTVAGIGMSMDFEASDPNGDSVIVKIEKGPDSAYLIPNIDRHVRTLVWNPTLNDIGSNVFVFSATDGQFIVLDSIVINVKQQNHAPVFLNSNKNFSADTVTPVSIQLNVSDPDSDQITLSLVHGPQMGLLNQRSKTFTWQPQKSDSGLITIIFSASDGIVGVFDTFTVNVILDNPPIFNLISNYSLNAGSGVSIGFDISDPDGDSVIVKIEKGPGSAYLTPNNSNPDSRILVFNTTTNDIGSNVFILSASDGKCTVLDTLIIDVKPQGPNLPVFSYLDSLWTAYANQTLTIEIKTTNPSSDSVSVGVSAMPPSTMNPTFDGPLYTGKGVFTITPSLADTGQLYTAIFGASNRRGLVSDTIKIRVEK